jgi:2-polyprenyl-3-methyl-5-hydroxy-6-metoxy-1,4-benzoquinol methylase
MTERIFPDTLEWMLYYQEHCQRYDTFGSICKGKQVLDAACGIGYGSKILADHGASSVCGLDISEDAVNYASEHFKTPAIQFRVGDCETLELLNMTFEIVISFETIEHLKHPEKLVEGAYHVLRENGVFVCSTPNILRHSLCEKQEAKNPYHPSEMSFEDFKSLFSKFFVVEEQYYQNESPQYLRHIEVVSELNRLSEFIAQSRTFSIEKALRKLLGRRTLLPPLISRSIERALPGDYIIKPLEFPGPSFKTYILKGRRR